MENNKISYIKCDDNKILNEKYIRWIKKFDECLEICAKQNGCSIITGDTIKVCKLYNPDSYAKLNNHFS